MRTLTCLAAIAGLLATCVPVSPAAGLPVGYDSPASDQGGPALTGGLQWLQRVWPRTLLFREQGAAERPTVLFITNYGGVDTVRELARRLPLDYVHLCPDSGNLFPGRDAFYKALRSRERFDCFVFSRFNMRTMPADAQYEILTRVREGAGLVVIDDYDRSPTFTTAYFGTKPVEKGPRIIPGIPYDGLRRWELADRKAYSTFNYWNAGGGLSSNPQKQPYAYQNVEVHLFGKGAVLWIDTGTHWARAGREGRTLLPHVGQSRDMYVETDYYYSHTAKAILKACGLTPRVQITEITPQGEHVAPGPVSVVFAVSGDQPFSGSLRWQMRDTWGIIRASGKEALNLPAGRSTAELLPLRFIDAGRTFLDLWVEDAEGAVVDWGSAFAEVDRRVLAPLIAPAHPLGTPRGEDLRATVSLEDAPAGAVLRLSLVDRYWREVARAEQPAAVGEVQFRAPTAGLDGQIWTLHADLLDADGRFLARSFTNLTSPHTRKTRGGFHPVMTCASMACPEEAARREYLRQIGFLANRPYSPGNALMAEASAWNDIQMHPFPFNIRGAENDYKHDAINDWEDPQVEAELLEAMRTITREQSPFGLRGYNFTDDSAPAKELPSAAYTTIRFHEWLRQEYGGLDGVVQAWGLNKSSFHSLARVHRGMIKAEYDAGNTAPWIDAQRFLQDLWIRDMEKAGNAAREINPDIVFGSDAGYYGEAMAELFGRLDYIAPYFRGDRVLRLAVARGASRRNGDFGACLGSYGEKPADMSERRSQIWDVLFAGGTGLYYWMFPGTGMAEDMTLSDAHARYQCEVVEEVMSGIGELFTGCKRVVHPVAILESQTSGICDQLEQKGKPLTTQELSANAFGYVLEDLGVNPEIITGPELADGWLENHGVRLLCLAGVCSMSDAEIQAVRDFVQGGGTVVTDILPGMRLPNGNLRKSPPLADLFGVSFDASKPPRIRGRLKGSLRPGEPELDFGPTLADPRITATDALHALTMVEEGAENPLEAQVLMTRETGTAATCLFNASFASYCTYRSDAGDLWRGWYTVMADILRACGITPEFSFSVAGAEPRGLRVTSFRNGEGYLLGVADQGFGPDAGKLRNFSIALPRSFHVYEIRSGRLLSPEPVARFEDRIPPRGHRAYCLLPARVEGLSLTGEARKRGPVRELLVRVDLDPAPGAPGGLHVVRLEARTPSGEPFFPFRRVLRVPPDGRLEIPLAVSRDDPSGDWTVEATDINSGVRATITVALGGDAG